MSFPSTNPPISSYSTSTQAPPPVGPQQIISEVPPSFWGTVRFNDFMTPNPYMRKQVVVGGASMNPYTTQYPAQATELALRTIPPNMWAQANTLRPE